MSSDNPYSTPRSEVYDRVEESGQLDLAHRGARLGAFLIDGLVISIAVFLPLVIFALMNRPLAMIRMSSLALLGVAVYNLVLLHQNGWTIGKKLVGIRIVRKDGSVASLGRTVGLRMLVNGLLSVIPFYGLFDVLFIFGDDQRCLHDLIAGTIVVQARDR